MKFFHCSLYLPPHLKKRKNIKNLSCHIFFSRCIYQVIVAFHILSVSIAFRQFMLPPVYVLWYIYALLIWTCFILFTSLLIVSASMLLVLSTIDSDTLIFDCTTWSSLFYFSLLLVFSMPSTSKNLRPRIMCQSIFAWRLRTTVLLLQGPHCYV